MSRARITAESLLTQYPLGPSCDLAAILKAENLIVVDFPLPGLRELIHERNIGINSFITDLRERRVILAHALGHWFLHKGSRCPNSTIRRYREQEADHFAEHLLAPNAMLHMLDGHSPEELAAAFDVPLSFLAQRLLHYQHALARLA